MIVVLSPAKKLEFAERAGVPGSTAPVLLPETTRLMKTVRQLSADDLSRLMKLSPSLAALNFERFQSFKTGSSVRRGTNPAALAFRGDTYVGLNADTFAAEDFEFAQAHVRILSGLYGLLAPLDRIQPYRLEMGTRLKTERGESLYDFWGDRITRALADAVTAAAASVVVNAASGEYFGAVKTAQLPVAVLTPVFKEQRGKALQVISFSAKRARGMIARYIVKNRVQSPEALKHFSEAGYRFRRELSSDAEYVFVRKQG